MNVDACFAKYLKKIYPAAYEGAFKPEKLTSVVLVAALNACLNTVGCSTIFTRSSWRSSSMPCVNSAVPSLMYAGKSPK